MKKWKKSLVLVLALSVLFAAAQGLSLSVLAEDEAEEFDLIDDFEDLDLDEDFEDLDFEDLDLDEGEEAYATETLEDGSVVETYTTTYEDGTVIEESYTTSPEGNTLRESFRYVDADGSVLSEEWEYVYDENGVLVSGEGVTTEKYPDHGEDDLTEVSSMTYDAMGNVLTETSEYTYGNGTVFTESWEYAYNEDGDRISGTCHATETDEEGAGVERDISETYGEDDNILTQYMQYSYSDGSVSSESWEYTYDEDGFCISGESVASDYIPGEGETVRTITETYNIDGSLLTQYIEYSYPETEE